MIILRTFKAVMKMEMMEIKVSVIIYLSQYELASENK